MSAASLADVTHALHFAAFGRRAERGAECRAPKNYTCGPVASAHGEEYVTCFEAGGCWIRIDGIVVNGGSVRETLSEWCKANDAGDLTGPLLAMYTGELWRLRPTPPEAP